MPQDNKMMTTVFQTDVTVLIGTETSEGMIPLSARLPNKSAFSRFVTLDRDTRIVSVVDQDEFRRFLIECRGKRGVGFSALRFILSVPIYLINLISGIVRSILGSFVGFGLIGILIVLFAVAASLLIGLYAFVVAAPFVLAGALLDFFERKMYRDAGSKFLKYLADEVSWGYWGDISVLEGLVPLSREAGTVVQEIESIA